MVTIHKYGLERVPGSNVVQMPRGAQVLSAQYLPAEGGVFLWVLVDTDESIMHLRTFIAAKTGGDDLEDIAPSDLHFIGTCQESQGVLVRHVFEYLTG